MITVPVNFDGEAFGAIYGSFRVSEGELICPGHPELTQEIVNTFVVDMARFSRIEQRRDSAKDSAKAIPNWATWSEAEAGAWFEANLGDAVVDGLGLPANVTTFLKALTAAVKGEGRFIIAIRDKEWPDLPE